MRSKRDLEGLVTVDHRDSPGMPDSVMIPLGMPVGSGKGFFETPTYTCSHCQVGVVMNPLRTRERAYCSGCDRYICDACGAEKQRTGICKTYIQFIEELHEAEIKRQQSNSIIIV